MCNPRRVLVTATRDIAEEWHREVSRTVALDGQVTGEARVRQPLARMGEPVLRALQLLLDQGVVGWTETELGYRYEVEGGYCLYDIEGEALEIVAALEATVAAQASVAAELHGAVHERLSTEQEGHYYDDGFGGHNESTALAEADRAAREALDQAARGLLDQAAEQAIAAQTPALEDQARALAEQRLAQAAESRRAELADQARGHLDTVGLRARQAFNALLAQAYREAILAYARSQGASGISVTDTDGVLDIELFIDG
jgi:hypothetical protein